MSSLPPAHQIGDSLPPPYMGQDPPPKYSVNVPSAQQRESSSRLRNLLGVSLLVQLLFMIVHIIFMLSIFFISALNNSSRWDNGGKKEILTLLALILFIVASIIFNIWEIKRLLRNDSQPTDRILVVHGTFSLLWALRCLIMIVSYVVWTHPANLQSLSAYVVALLAYLVSFAWCVGKLRLLQKCYHGRGGREDVTALPSEIAL